MDRRVCTSVSAHALVIVGTLASPGAALAQSVLHDNGPIITNPTGGTGSIDGLPISNSDQFNIPGSTFNFSTTGIGATVPVGVAVAENFVVPESAGQGWDLDTLTVFAFQSGQTSPSVTSIEVNLWTAAPFSADSPETPPDPLPTPVLESPLVLDPADLGGGVFVCHRQSISSTTTVRPVYAYTVSLDGLPNNARLAPGEYWIQWSFTGAASPSQNVFTPLVSPRDAVTGHNARLLNSIDGSSAGPRVWFEGREGYVAGVTEGRAYELPFILKGEVLGAGGSCLADVDDGSSTGTPDDAVTIDDLLYYLTIFASGDIAADVDNGTGTATQDGAVTIDDLLYYIQRFQAGC